MQHIMEVNEATQVGEARRLAATLARDLGLNETDQGRLAIAVTEAASNVVKHGRGGQLLFTPVLDGEARGIGVLAMDRGPGMADVDGSRRDGFSTAGSMGTGLGAIARQSNQHDVYSAPEHGTALAAWVWAEGRTPAAGRVLAGGISVPAPGESVCGDGWAVAPFGDRTVLLVVDGLGHGAGAAEAAEQAIDCFRHIGDAAPGEILQRLHEQLRPTRGAAAAVADLDLGARLVRYCGIGNICGTILAGDDVRHMVSHHGTLGHDMRRVQEFQYPWASGGHLVLHSDGLSSHWDLGRYPGLLPHQPMVIAAILLRDFRRQRDDATVVVAREAA